MLLKKVIFKVQHFGKIVAAQLDRSLSHLLPDWRDLRALFEEKNSFVRDQRELTRQGQAGEPGAQHDNVEVVVHFDLDRWSGVCQKERSGCGFHRWLHFSP